MIDVFPDGTAINLATGGQRARYRNDRKNPQALTPDEITCFEFGVRAISNVFKAGHRIRIEVTSSDAYMYDINPNQFIDLRTAKASDYRTAKQTIYHDAEHPSAVILPIISQEHKRDWIEAWPFSPSKTGGYDGIAAQNITYRLNAPIETDANVLGQ